MSEITYPSNAHSEKEKHEEEKTYEKVISGKASVKKRRLGARLADIFLGDDIGNVKSYLIFEMLIPGIKDMILGGMEMMFYGGTKRYSERGKRSNNISKPSYMVDYGSYSKKPERRRDRDNDERVSIDDICFESLADAQEVLESLKEDIRNYGEATLAAYYQYSGISNSDFTANDRGWTDLSMVSRPRRVRGGHYILDLPRPQIL